MWWGQTRLTANSNNRLMRYSTALMRLGSPGNFQWVEWGSTLWRTRFSQEFSTPGTWCMRFLEMSGLIRADWSTWFEASINSRQNCPIEMRNICPCRWQASSKWEISSTWRDSRNSLLWTLSSIYSRKKGPWLPLLRLIFLPSPSSSRDPIRRTNFTKLPAPAICSASTRFTTTATKTKSFWLCLNTAALKISTNMRRYAGSINSQIPSCFSATFSSTSQNSKRSKSAWKPGSAGRTSPTFSPSQTTLMKARSCRTSMRPALNMKAGKAFSGGWGRTTKNLLNTFLQGPVVTISSTSISSIICTLPGKSFDIFTSLP